MDFFDGRVLVVVVLRGSKHGRDLEEEDEIENDKEKEEDENGVAIAGSNPHHSLSLQALYLTWHFTTFPH